MHNVEDVKKHLISVGFNPYNSESTKRLTGCEWSMFKRTKYEDAKNCLCNDKAPQIGVYYDAVTIGGKLRESYSVELCQENDIVWLNFKYYGLSHKDIIGRFDEIEEILINSWEASWRNK